MSKSSDEKKVLLNATLCLLVRDNQVLLAKKTRKIGAGFWNGYGGGIDNGESARTAACRELREEAVVTASECDLSEVARIDFHNHKADGGQFVCRMHVFLLEQWVGEPKPTEEMVTPTWFPFENIPFGELMLADRHWLPRVLAGCLIVARAEYGPRQEFLIGDVEIKQVDTLP